MRRRLIRLFDGRRIDTTAMTQAEELAHLRTLLGKHYAQRVAAVEYLEAPEQESLRESRDERSG